MIGYGFNFVDLFLHLHREEGGVMNEGARDNALGRVYVDTKMATMRGG